MATTLEAPSAPVTAAPARQVRARAASPNRAGRWKYVLGLAVAALAAVWLTRVALHAYRYEETEDAYVTGHLHQVAPQIDGQVKAVLVADNQDVKAGDVLVQLDPLQFQLGLEKARASLAQAKAMASQSRAAENQAQAQLTETAARTRQAEAQQNQTAAQLELAKLTLARNEQLFAAGGVNSRADLDNARSAAKAAEAAQAANEANVAAAQSAAGSAEATLISARAQIAAADATVAVAESAVRDAKRQLGYATIVAPAAGRVGNRMVEVGNRVLAGQGILAIAAPDPWIIANFKETQLARMHAGQDVELTIDAVPGKTLHGTIDSIAPASGAQFALLPPDNATGNFNKVVQRVPVKILLDDSARAALGDRLRLGLSAVVNVRVR